MRCEVALRVEGLTRLYASGAGVRGVSFSLCTGEVTALVGPNGAGKTTLFDALALQAGFTGELELFGVPNHEEVEYKRRMAYLPEARGFPPFLTPRVTVRLAEDFWLQKGLLARFQTEAERLGFAPAHLDVLISDLSQGTREKLALALVFSREAPFYLLDEPEAHLDPIVRAQLESRLQQLGRDGKTVLFATHDVHLAVRLADRILVIRNGRLFDLGAVKRVEEVLAALVEPGSGEEVGDARLD